MADKKHGNIIIVKKKGGHGGHHGGAWKVAYADFVTAMMAFFLVMWIVGQSKAVKSHVQGYFQDPAAYAAKLAAGVFDGGQGVMTASGPALQPEIAPLNEQEAHAALERAGQEILRELTQAKGLADISNQVDIQVTDEGLRIQLMEAGEATFFDLGNARLSPYGEKALSTIAKTIASLNMDVAVEGHTDSRRFGRGGDYTNWELSADRANAARRLLEQRGVPTGHIAEVRGYADTRLRYPAAPEDPRNRRISIIVFRKLFDRKAGAADLPKTGGSPAEGPAAEGHVPSAVSPRATEAPPPAHH